MWNIIISSDDCSEHPDYRKNWKELCNLIGQCTYENCPLRDKEFDKMKFLEKMHETLSRGDDPYDD